MKILSPADGLETVKAVHAMADTDGPVYLRLTGKGTPDTVVYHEDYDFVFGKGVTLKDGEDAAIIASGAVVFNALQASKKLEKEKGIHVRVIDIHTIKPIDEAIIRKAAKETGHIFAVEEHSLFGGLGSAVCEIASGIGNCPEITRLGLPDAFGKIAEYNDQLIRYGLDADSIAVTIARKLKI